MSADINISNNNRIGVLMGGASSEREISLKSGAAVYEALKSRNYDVVALDLKTDKNRDAISVIKKSDIKIAFIAMHGHYGEDGCLQSLLDKLRIPYTGSGWLASRMAMDKIASRKIFKQAGIPVPKTVIIDKKLKRDINVVIKKIGGFPLVVKPACQGSSIGISIVSDTRRLKEAIRIAKRLDSKILIEEYIKGRELTVGILGDKPLPVIEIVPKEKFFDFEAKYHSGTDYIVPASLPDDVNRNVQLIALRAHRAIDCKDFSRVDLILNEDYTPVVLEVNSIPGLTARSLLPKAASASGVSFEELCSRLIKGALCQRKNKK